MMLWPITPGSESVANLQRVRWESMGQLFDETVEGGNWLGLRDAVWVKGLHVACKS